MFDMGPLLLVALLCDSLEESSRSIWERLGKCVAGCGCFLLMLALFGLANYGIYRLVAG
jgi:hypothetical protein